MPVLCVPGTAGLSTGASTARSPAWRSAGSRRRRSAHHCGLEGTARPSRSSIVSRHAQQQPHPAASQHRGAPPRRSCLDRRDSFCMIWLSPFDPARTWPAPLVNHPRGIGLAVAGAESIWVLWDPQGLARPWNMSCCDLACGEDASMRENKFKRSFAHNALRLQSVSEHRADVTSAPHTHAHARVLTPTHMRSLACLHPAHQNTECAIPPLYALYSSAL